MKKIFTILTVVVLTTTASFGQFSAKAGLNLANMSISGSGSDDSENGMKLGMIIGANYNAELSDAMSLDVSVAFKQSGTRISCILGNCTPPNTYSAALSQAEGVFLAF